MMPKFRVACYGGSGIGCLEGRCPIFAAAEESVRKHWPFTPTGFGNLYGEPTREHYLSEVRACLGSTQNGR